MNEKKFLKPNAEIITFNDGDIIVTSSDIDEILTGSIPWYDPQPNN